MATIDIPHRSETSPPLSGGYIARVPDHLAAHLEPAAWIVHEWTRYTCIFPGATRLKVGSLEIAPLVEGVFQVQFENQLGLTSIITECRWVYLLASMVPSIKMPIPPLAPL